MNHLICKALNELSKQKITKTYVLHNLNSKVQTNLKKTACFRYIFNCKSKIEN